MPASAATNGRRRSAGRDSSPATISRLISSPTSRKNSAIRPSLIHRCTVMGPIAGASTGPVSAWSRWKYSPASGELARIIASAAAAISTIPPIASSASNCFRVERVRRIARLVAPKRGARHAMRAGSRSGDERFLAVARHDAAFTLDPGSGGALLAGGDFFPGARGALAAFLDVAERGGVAIGTLGGGTCAADLRGIHRAGSDSGERVERCRGVFLTFF